MTLEKIALKVQDLDARIKKIQIGVWLTLVCTLVSVTMRLAALPAPLPTSKPAPVLIYEKPLKKYF